MNILHYVEIPKVHVSVGTRRVLRQERIGWAILSHQCLFATKNIMLPTIAKDPKLHRLLPKRSISSPIRTSKARQMTTTHRLALLYTLLTAYFISQTCAAQPIVQKCVVSNKTFMLAM